MKNTAFGIATFCILIGVFLYLAKGSQPLPPLQPIAFTDDASPLSNSPSPALETQPLPSSAFGQDGVATELQSKPCVADPLYDAAPSENVGPDASAADQLR
jgi:hypothetical protein